MGGHTKGDACVFQELICIKKFGHARRVAYSTVDVENPKLFGYVAMVKGSKLCLCHIFKTKTPKQVPRTLRERDGVCVCVCGGGGSVYPVLLFCFSLRMFCLAVVEPPRVTEPLVDTLPNWPNTGVEATLQPRAAVSIPYLCATTTLLQPRAEAPCNHVQRLPCNHV